MAQKTQEKLFRTVLGTTGTVRTFLLPESLATKPLAFDGRKRWRGHLTPIQDQRDCGACYAFATCAVLQDRYWLFGPLRPIFNPIEVLVCQTPELTQQELRLLRFDPAFRLLAEQQTQREACGGGTITQTARFLFQSGARDCRCPAPAPPQVLPLCSELQNVNAPLWPVQAMYRVGENSLSLSELGQRMQRDICQHGPLLAGFWIYRDFLEGYDGRSIYVPQPGQRKLGGHAVRVVGWGRDGDLDFWLCLNSWGTHWGQRGAFRLVAASPLLELERNHVGLIPQIPGILRYFRLVNTPSELRTLDEMLRNATGVNPFTLLSRAATDHVVERGVDPALIFSRLQYPIHASLLSCCRASPAAPLLLGLGLTTALVVLLVLLFHHRHTR
jgi:hypothetical protein